MGFLKNWMERRNHSLAEEEFAGFLSAMASAESMTAELAMQIPTVAGCVEFISGIVAGLPIKLYQEAEDAVEEVRGDPRLIRLNDETGDILSGQQLKKALVRDYLLYGCSYAYKNMRGNALESLHYVRRPAVSVNLGPDPVFKRAELLVNGRRYREFQFIKLLRATPDGVTGRGAVHENSRILALAYNSMVYENTLVKTGGNKRGFLKSEEKLSDESLKALKEGFLKMYSNTDTGVIVLNKGVEFQQASSTAVELQLRENKEANGVEICKLFCLSPNILSGRATEAEFQNGIKTAVMPVVAAFEAALNKDLLLEEEKTRCFFAFDTAELLKGDVEKLYRAYTEAVKAGWISKNEIRYRENLKEIPGLDVVSMSLGDVIYDIKTGRYFTPNLGELSDMSSRSGGGQEHEN